MPGPGITRPDLCSKRAAARQPEFADTARGPLSADSYPPAGDDPLAPMPHYAARTLIEASALRTFGYPDRPAGAPRDQPPQSADGGGAMTALPTSSGGSRATAASSIDHAIRLSTAAAGWDRFRAVRAGCGLPNSSQPVTEEESMSDPGFTRPDLCSIRAAAGQEELAEAVRGGFSADG